MSSHPEPGADLLSAADEERLVRLLDAFEAELRDGANPRIEAYLERVDERLRPYLQRDLEGVQQEWFAGPLRARLAGEAARTTLFLESGTRAVGEPSLARVDVVPGNAPSLETQTAELLRIRLRAVSLLILAGLGVFLVRALWHPGSPLIWLRVVAVLGAAICAWRLSVARTRIRGPWRLLELALIVILGVQTTALQVAEMSRAAAGQDVVTVNTAMLFAFATWAVAGLGYATVIPNTWTRAAAILLPLSAIPLVVSLALISSDPLVAAAVRRDVMYGAATLVYVAAATAIAGTYTVHRLRTQLFQARRFGQYRLVRFLGRGGMGEVYLAEHQLLKRPSAIKLIRPGLDTKAEVVARFEREVQATAALSHWNTVAIFDYGRTDDNAFYYVMEYLEGATLQQLVDRQGPLPPGRVVYFLSQICAALAEAHHAGLVHQDIKPANIFATRCGSQYDVAKLLDFGLVQEIAAPGSESAWPGLATRPIVGTPRFLSPEQAQGRLVPDIRSDIYSLGATAWYLLTGEPVFSRGTVAELLRAHLTEAPRPPSRIRRQIPPELDAIVLKCLSKRPEDRYQQVGQLEQALAACPAAAAWDARRAADWWRQARDSDRTRAGERADSRAGERADSRTGERADSQVGERADSQVGGTARRPAGGGEPDRS